MEFYRYETVRNDYGPFIRLNKYNLHKETPKGYWIGYGSLREGQLRSHSKWVSKTGKKRYAYPTREEALVNYIKRCEIRTAILSTQLSDMHHILRMIEKEKEKNNSLV